MNSLVGGIIGTVIGAILAPFVQQAIKKLKAGQMKDTAQEVKVTGHITNVEHEIWNIESRILVDRKMRAFRSSKYTNYAMAVYSFFYSISIGFDLFHSPVPYLHWTYYGLPILQTVWIILLVFDGFLLMKSAIIQKECPPSIQDILRSLR
jgi:hypothetical protein